MLDLALIRRESIAVAAQLGYGTNEALPLLDEPLSVRPVDEVVDRLIAMHCVAASAYGFDGKKASVWLEREAKTNQLTDSERRFLHSNAGDRQQFILQIEGMWALAWAISVVAILDFSSQCSQEFVLQLPDLKGDKSADEIRSKASIRPLPTLIGATDLAYCLHWAIRDADLRGEHVPRNCDRWAIVERRRALEWLLSNQSWQDVTMDT